MVWRGKTLICPFKMSDTHSYIKNGSGHLYMHILIDFCIYGIVCLAGWVLGGLGFKELVCIWGTELCWLRSSGGNFQ